MKITFYNLQKGIRYLRNYGLREFFIRLSEKGEPENISYSDWYNKHKAAENELKKQIRESEHWEVKPLFMVFIQCGGGINIDAQAVKRSIYSVLEQSYGQWSICVLNAPKSMSDELSSFIKAKAEHEILCTRADDILRDIEQTASGKWSYAAFLEAGHILSPDALYQAANAIENPASIRQSGVHWDDDKSTIPDMIYTDEDMIQWSGDESDTDPFHYAPEFKPDFNLDLLRANNYMKHFLVVSREIFIKAVTAETEPDVDKCFDFVFKCAENANRIVHIPRVLYSCVKGDDNDCINADTEIKAIVNHLNRAGIKAEVRRTDYEGYYRIRYTNDEKPLVSILIPNKDERDSLDKCLKSIAAGTYDNIEIIIIENNSTEPETFEYYKSLPERYDGKFEGGIKVVSWESNGLFNYSAINNYGRANAKGEYLVLLNNDIEIISRDWIEEMLSVCTRKDAGIVGAKLYYPDDTIQHAGIVAAIGGHARGVASNMLVGLDRYGDGSYMHKASVMQDYSAVTAACLMIKASVYDRIGGFEERLTVAFNDVDLCLKARKAGYLVVYDPYVEAYHYESKSRGQEDTEEKVRRFQDEIEYMRSKWNDIMRYGDPYYNPNLSRIKNDYSLNGMD